MEIKLHFLRDPTTEERIRRALDGLPVIISEGPPATEQSSCLVVFCSDPNPTDGAKAMIEVIRLVRGPGIEILPSRDLMLAWRTLSLDVDEDEDQGDDEDDPDEVAN